MTLPANLLTRENVISDWRVFDFLEPVTVETPHRPSNFSTYVPLAKRRALQIEEPFPTSGVYQAAAVAWIIPVELAPQLECVPGSVVIDHKTQTRWTAQKGTALNSWGTWWRLPSLNLIISHALFDQIDIERASLSTGPSGAYIKSWPSGPAPLGGSLLYHNLPCRVQPTDDEIVDERGIRGEQDNYRVIVDRQVVVDTAEDRIRFVDAGGRIGAKGAVHYFDLVSLENSAEIGELPALVVRERP